MKHLKPFNENIAQKYLNAYNILKDVFAELIDDTSIQVDTTTQTHEGKMSVIITFNKTKIGDKTTCTPEELVSKYERVLELTKDVAVCVKRAEQELDCESELSVIDDRIYCRFTIDKNYDLPF